MDTCSFQSAACLRGHGIGRGFIDMHAQCVDVSREQFAAHREDDLIANHHDDSFCGDRGVGDDGARDLARREVAVVVVQPVDERFAGDAQSSSFPARSISDPASAT